MRICVVTDIHAQPELGVCISRRFPDGFTAIRYELNALCNRSDLSGSDQHEHVFRDGGAQQVLEALAQILDGDTLGLGYSLGDFALACSSLGTWAAHAVLRCLKLRFRIARL